MARDDPYLSFNLCLLSKVLDISKPNNLRIVFRRSVITQACYIAGQGWIEKNEDWAVESRMQNWPELDSEHQQALILGADHLKIEIRSVERAAEEMGSLREFVMRFEDTHGTDSTVRLRADIVREFIDGTGGLTARDICVFCGILSILGNKKWSWIGVERIRAAAHGFKSQKVMEAELRDSSSGWITVHQVRSAIERLERRGFLTSAISRGRSKAFSTRLSQARLVQFVRSDLENKRMREEQRKPAQI